MAIPSQTEAEEALNTIGYYRLRGYCYHQFDRHTNQYIIGTNFSNVLKLYHTVIIGKVNGTCHQIIAKTRTMDVNMVLTGTGDYAYRRHDGVYVVSIGCLKN